MNWLLNHPNETHTLREWLELIAASASDCTADYGSTDTPLGERSRPGRPPKYSRKLAIKVCLALANHRSLSAVAKHFQIHRNTLWRWRSEHSEFDVMYRITQHCIKRMREKEEAAFAPLRKDQRRVSRRLRKLLHSPHEESRRGRGRRTNYRSEFCDRVQSSWSQTADQLGVTKRTIANWCKAHPEFKRAQDFKSMLCGLRRTEDWLKRNSAIACEVTDR